MTGVSIKAELRTGRALAALEAAMTEWGDDRKRRFVSEWEALEAAGAEVAEVQFVGGRLIGYPSEDFTRHLAAHGVHLW